MSKLYLRRHPGARRTLATTLKQLAQGSLAACFCIAASAALAAPAPADPEAPPIASPLSENWSFDPAKAPLCKKLRDANACAVAIEAAQIKARPKVVERRGRRLTVHLRDDTPVDFDDLADCKTAVQRCSFRYIESFPKAHLHVIGITKLQSIAILLLDDRTGAVTDAPGPVSLSPGGKLLFSLNSDTLSGPAMAAWDMEDDSDGLDEPLVPPSAYGITLEPRFLGWKNKHVVRIGDSAVADPRICRNAAWMETPKLFDLETRKLEVDKQRKIVCLGR